MRTFNPAALRAPLDIVAQAIAGNAAPGAIVSASLGGLTVETAAGYSDETTDAATNQHFEIGSQTKMMTATVVQQLAEAGLLDLDAALADYLPPALLDGLANAGTATLRDALTMRSGIPDYTVIEGEDGVSLIALMAALSDDPVGPLQALDLVRGLPATSAPGAFDYSNTNYTLLGLVVEAVTGMDLGDVLQAAIFEPLGMTGSYLDDFRADPLRWHSYALFDGDLQDVTDIGLDKFAEGGVVSSVADMTAFLRGLLVDGALLSEDALETMADFAETGLGFGFGAGLILLDLGENAHLVGFSGGTAGTQASTFLHLETGAIVSAAVNFADAETGANMAAVTALQAALGTASWAAALADGPLLVEGVSAAALEITSDESGTEIAADGVSLALEVPLTEAVAQMSFADGSEILLGTDGADRLRVTGNADDRLMGCDGHDLLVGGDGDDRLIGGAGNDRMAGGAGADVFVFGESHDNGWRERDTILDFDLATDRLDLCDATISGVRETGAGVMLILDGDGDAIWLAGVHDADALTFL